MSARARPTSWAIRLAWLAAVVPIVAWIVHLGLTAALVDRSCTHANVTWIMHGLTVFLGLVCIVCGAYGFVVWRRRNGTGNGNGNGNGAFRFLGLLVVAIAATNLLLIVWEGSYTEFLSNCR